jgi:hypothetical protein
MHDKPWGTAINSWRSQGIATKSRAWGESSTKITNRNDNKKRSSATYDHDSYQDKRSRNDRGRSPSRDGETAHHSTMTKRNSSILPPDFTPHHRKLAIPRDITRTKRHERKRTENT